MARSLQRNWSALQTDVVELILKRLGVIDTIRFRGVCSSWNTAVKRYVSSKSYAQLPQSPTILLLQTPSELRKSSLSLFSPREGVSYAVKITSSFDKYYKGGDCVGSSYGWLAILSRTRDFLRLLNPFSGAEIQLPSLKSLGRLPESTCNVFLSSDPSSRSKGFSVAISYISYFGNVLPQSQMLAFCKYGDHCGGGGDKAASWTSVKLNNDIYDCMICHNGRIYAFSNRTGTLDVWDFNSLRLTEVIDIEQPFTVNLRKLPIILDSIQHSRIRKYYWSTIIVESLGEILFVDKIGIYFDDKHDGELETTIGFNVSEVNYSEERRVRLHSLPERAILLGSQNQAISVSTREFPELQENSIYFVEGSDYRLKVYNIEEEEIRLCQYGKLKFNQHFDLNHSNHWIFPVLKIC